MEVARQVAVSCEWLGAHRCMLFFVCCFSSSFFSEYLQVALWAFKLLSCSTVANAWLPGIVERDYVAEGPPLAGEPARRRCDLRLSSLYRFSLSNAWKGIVPPKMLSLLGKRELVAPSILPGGGYVVLTVSQVCQADLGREAKEEHYD